MMVPSTYQIGRQEGYVPPYLTQLLFVATIYPVITTHFLLALLLTKERVWYKM
jgi:hypothetical protein